MMSVSPSGSPAPGAPPTSSATQSSGPPGGTMTTALPAPPAGPGVRPPFVAPPTDGNRRRLWTGLGSAAVVLVLLCGGGVAGFAALVRGTIQERRDDATKAVTAFLTDLQHDDFVRAYRSQCSEIRKQTTFAQFTDAVSTAQIVSFRLEQPEINTDATIVPAQLTFADGGLDHERFVVIVESDGTNRVCGDE
jgi:hypothetical protein